MKNIDVSLTPDEVYAQCAVATHRRITSMFGRKKAQHYECPDNTEWSTEIESCGAEMSFAKFKNWYWSGAEWNGRVAESDVSGVQVRHTHYRSGCLVLYPADRDDQRFVLVIGRCPNYTVVGWIWGVAGKKKEFWKSDARSPAWFVPQTVLHEFAGEAKKQIP